MHKPPTVAGSKKVGLQLWHDEILVQVRHPSGHKVHIPLFIHLPLGQVHVPETKSKVANDPTRQLRQLFDKGPKQVPQVEWQFLQVGGLVVKSLYKLIVVLQHTPNSSL